MTLVMETAQPLRVAVALASFNGACGGLPLVNQLLCRPVPCISFVVHRAKAMPKVLSRAAVDAAASAKTCAILPRRMFLNMLGLCKQFEILDPVVVLDLVPVMNQLRRLQRSAQMLGHHIAVLKDIAVSVAIRMLRLPNKAIAVLSSNKRQAPMADQFPVVTLDEAYRFALAPSAGRHGVFRDRCCIPAAALTKSLIHADIVPLLAKVG